MYQTLANVGYFQIHNTAVSYRTKDDIHNKMHFNFMSHITQLSVNIPDVHPFVLSITLPLSIYVLTGAP